MHTYAHRGMEPKETFIPLGWSSCLYITMYCIFGVSTFKGLLSIPCDGRGARRPLGQSFHESVGPRPCLYLDTMTKIVNRRIYSCDSISIDLYKSSTHDERIVFGTACLCPVPRLPRSYRLIFAGRRATKNPYTGLVHSE